MSKKSLRRLLVELMDDEASTSFEPLVPSLHYLKENVAVGSAMTRDVPIYEDDYLKVEFTTKITRKK